MIDYEKIVDETGNRLVKFGQFAGYAGMIDMLHAMGDRLLALGYSTPLLHIGYSYCYPSLEAAKEAVRSVGDELKSQGLPAEFLPLTVAFTSYGSVSMGAQEIFKLLPHKFVTPDELVKICQGEPPKDAGYCIYACVLTAEHMVAPNDPNAEFDKEEYGNPLSPLPSCCPFYLMKRCLTRTYTQVLPESSHVPFHIQGQGNTLP